MDTIGTYHRAYTSLTRGLDGLKHVPFKSHTLYAGWGLDDYVLCRIQDVIAGGSFIQIADGPTASKDKNPSLESTVFV